MGRRCTICTHPHRDDIERALWANESQYAIANRFQLSQPAVSNHFRKHMPAAQMVKDQAPVHIGSGDDLLQQIHGLHARTLAILADAEARNDVRTALFAIREARANLELVSKIYAFLASAGGETTTIRIVDETVPIPEFDEEDQA